MIMTARTSYISRRFLWQCNTCHTELIYSRFWVLPLQIVRKFTAQKYKYAAFSSSDPSALMKNASNSKMKAQIRLHSDHIRRRTLDGIIALECCRMNSSCILWFTHNTIGGQSEVSVLPWQCRVSRSYTSFSNLGWRRRNCSTISIIFIIAMQFF